MQVDDEEEKPPDTESEITREGTKTLLKRCGATYSDDNADRVYEDRITRKHIEEDLIAKLAESNKQIQLVLKINEEKKTIRLKGVLTRKIIEDSMKNQKAELLNEVAKLFEKNQKGNEANNEKQMNVLIKRLDAIDKNNDENERKVKVNEGKAATSQKEFHDFLKKMSTDADTERKEAAKRAEKQDENNLKLQNLMASDQVDLKKSKLSHLWMIPCIDFCSD